MLFFVESVVSLDSQKLSEDKNYRKKYNFIQLQAKIQADVTILNKSKKTAMSTSYTLESSLSKFIMKKYVIQPGACYLDP